MNTRISAVLLAASVTALVASCSAGGEDPAPQPSATVVTSEVASDYPPVPTPDALNAELERGFDPAVPLEEKTTFIQGAQEDPAIVDQVVAAAMANDATVEITSVDDLGDGTLSAGATLSVGGQPNPATMIFVAEDGVWKLSRDNACAIVGLAGLTTPVCPV